MEPGSTDSSSLFLTSPEWSTYDFFHSALCQRCLCSTGQTTSLYQSTHRVLWPLLRHREKSGLTLNPCHLHSPLLLAQPCGDHIQVWCPHVGVSFFKPEYRGASAAGETWAGSRRFLSRQRLKLFICWLWVARESRHTPGEIGQFHLQMKRQMRWKLHRTSVLLACRTHCAVELIPALLCSWVRRAFLTVRNTISSPTQPGRGAA